MKIAYILSALANDGPILVVKDIVTHLKKYAEIDVFYFDDNEQLIFDCPVKKISFFESINFEDYDIIHSNMLRPDAYVFFHRKKIKGKYVSTIHNYVEPDLQYKYNKVVSLVFTQVWKLILRKHDRLITLSKDMQAYYKKLYKHSAISYIYNGRDISPVSLSKIEQEEADEINNFKKNCILIGVAALLTYRKGIDQLLRLLAANQRYKLLIIGDGQVRNDLVALAKELKVLDRCLFLGFKLHADRYYSFFDIYAMPSRSEGFPLALIEAAAYGLPSICSDLPVLKEIFNEEEVVFFQLENIMDLQQKMEFLCANKETFSKNIQVKYKKELTAGNMAANYYKTYLELLEQ